jgi:hypothetical protein
MGKIFHEILKFLFQFKKAGQAETKNCVFIILKIFEKS